MNDGKYDKYVVENGILVGYGKITSAYADQFGSYVNYVDENGNESFVFIDGVK